MTKELFKKYVQFLKGLNFVETNGVGKNVKIRGEKYWIRRNSLPFLTDALIETNHLENITCQTVLELTKALKKANDSFNYNLLKMFYSIKIKSQKEIELFIQLVMHPSPKIQAQFEEELKTAV